MATVVCFFFNVTVFFQLWQPVFQPWRCFSTLSFFPLHEIKIEKVFFQLCDSWPMASAGTRKTTTGEQGNTKAFNCRSERHWKLSGGKVENKIHGTNRRLDSRGETDRDESPLHAAM